MQSPSQRAGLSLRLVVDLYREMKFSAYHVINEPFGECESYIRVTGDHHILGLVTIRQGMRGALGTPEVEFRDTSEAEEFGEALRLGRIAFEYAEHKAEEMGVVQPPPH